MQLSKIVCNSNNTKNNFTNLFRNKTSFAALYYEAQPAVQHNYGTTFSVLYKKKNMKSNSNKQNRNSRIPENNPSKAMDSKREVEQANDPKIDQDFPGYPHYPSKEDIMDQRTGSHKVDMDVENLASGRNATGVDQRFITQQESKRTNNEPGRNAPDDEMDVLNSRDEEIGIPQNISNQDLNKKHPGSDLEKDADEDR